MAKKASMILRQLIAMIDRKIIYCQKSERFAKNFNSWEHLVSMLFCQVAKQKASEKSAAALPVARENEASGHESGTE